jgi:hypothetical protein
MQTKTISFAIVAALLIVSVMVISETQIAEAKKAPKEHKAPKHFKAKINADQEVIDPVKHGDPALWDDVKAKGDVKFKLSKDGSELKYKIKIKDIKNIVGIHIHKGAPGMNAHDHLVDIIETDTSNPINQKGKHFKWSGVITDDDVLMNHMTKEVRTLADVVEAMSNSHAYLQVHTSSDVIKDSTGPGDLYGPGEVRGNISPGHK